MAQELLPSTVQIVAEFDGEAGGATGSGFVLDAEGHIITNNHVVASAAEDDGPIEVVDTDGNRYSAELVGPQPGLRPGGPVRRGRRRTCGPPRSGASETLNIGDGGRRHRLAARASARR